MNRKKIAEETAELVLHAAGRLGKSEADLFAQAYLQWFSRSPGQAQLDCYLLQYRQQGTVPFWVRGFIRSSLGRQFVGNGMRRRSDWPRRISCGIALLFSAIVLTDLLTF